MILVWFPSLNCNSIFWNQQQNQILKGEGKKKSWSLCHCHQVWTFNTFLLTAIVIRELPSIYQRKINQESSHLGRWLFRSDGGRRRKVTTRNLVQPSLNIKTQNGRDHTFILPDWTPVKSSPRSFSPSSPIECLNRKWLLETKRIIKKTPSLCLISSICLPYGLNCYSKCLDVRLLKAWKGGKRNWMHHRILPEHSNLSILW